ncbi:CAMK family protein kinase [Tritrichomonas foetus]|uniref:CAMK family protein kinase n=1 Tax=Tritrichomonas foetus TaxID=1144522 RepID=A0A1J4JVQ7_9EUKA|nr:CAMK family protein kinase [Tritrichomonas foetus]|eukprot:OHT03225.1 CAMK family protein kinase [Tritrichomonas foetus]
MELTCEELQKKYNIICPIGSGASSTVFLGTRKEDDFPVAIKLIIFNSSGVSNEYIRYCKEEIAIMRCLNHPSIVKIFDIIETSEYLAIITEYLNNGSLMQQINYGKPIGTTRYIKNIFRQIVQALDYLHNDMKIVHRDLKAENILFDEQNQIKIIDFGFSKRKSGHSIQISDNDELLMSGQSSSQDESHEFDEFVQTDSDDSAHNSHEDSIEVSERNDLFTTRCGSPCYASPEVIKGEGYYQKADIWSLGVLLYLMTTGVFPFYDANLNKLFNLVMKKPLDFPSDLQISDELKDLLNGMLDKNAETRMSINDVICHSWLLASSREVNISSAVSCDIVLPSLHSLDPTIQNIRQNRKRIWKTIAPLPPGGILENIHGFSTLNNSQTTKGDIEISNTKARRLIPTTLSGLSAIRPPIIPRRKLSVDSIKKNSPNTSEKDMKLTFDNIPEESKSPPESTENVQRDLLMAHFNRKILQRLKSKQKSISWNTCIERMNAVSAARSINSATMNHA